MNYRAQHKILPFLILIVVSLYLTRPTLVQGQAGTPTRTATPTSIPTLDEVANPADIAALPAGTNVVINFNNFTSPSDGRTIPAGYAGINWNTLVEGSPWAGITTWNIFITSGGTQGTITFPRPVIFKSVRVGSGSTNIFTVASNGNPTVNLTTSSNSPQTLVTGWINPVTSLTLRSSTTDHAFDDLRMTMSGGAQTPTATIAASNTSTPSIPNTPTPTPTTIISSTLPGGNTPTQSSTPIATIAPSPTTPPSSGELIADNSVISLFGSIPQSAIDAAKAKKVWFYHQSTGGYITFAGLDCLAGLRNDPNNYPQECIDAAQNPSKYDWSQWHWSIWPQPQADAVAKMDQFVSLVPGIPAQYEIIGMKFCYVDGWNQDFEQYRTKMEALENQNPNKTFLWTTSALWSDPGTACNPSNPFNSCLAISDFNNQLRAYARANHKPLYDIASIESNGGACQVGGYEGLCSEYYSDGGGHPNNAASIRLAKGFWWLIARISGWSGSSATTSTPIATGLPTSTTNPTTTGTPAATTTPSATNAPSATPTVTSNEVVNPANISTLPAGTNVLINFDNFASPSDGRAVPGGYAGIIWNTLVEGAPWAGITSWNIFITNGGAQGTITFPRPVIVKSIRVTSGSSNVYTLTSTGNANVTLTTSGNNPQTLVTGWVNPVTSLTLRSSSSDQVFDDLRLTTN